MKKIVELLPVFTIALILLSYINLAGYYGILGIDIYNYIDTTELLLAFIPFVYDYISITISLFIILVSFLALANLKIRNPFTKRISFTKRITTQDVKFLATQVASFVILIAAIYNGVKYYTTDHLAHIDNTIKYYIRMQSSWFIIVFGSIVPSLPTSYKKRYKFAILIAAYVFIVISFKEYSYYKGIKSIIKNETKNISFVVNDKIINSSDTLVFFGETSNFIFLYHVFHQTTTVYNKEDIDSIVYMNPSYLKQKKTKYTQSCNDTSRRISPKPARD